MRIYCVCGAGIGTSVLLAKTVEKALAELEFEAEVSAVPLLELPSRDSAQLILATSDVATSIQKGSSELITVQSVVDLEEIRGLLSRALS